MEMNLYWEEDIELNLHSDIEEHNLMLMIIFTRTKEDRLRRLFFKIVQRYLYSEKHVRSKLQLQLIIIFNLTQRNK